MDFERLVTDALEEQFTGWDWSAYAHRYREAAPPWDYPAMVRAALPGTASLLDLGTGGGERLSSFAPLPPDTAATEGYPPNLPIARQRLAPMGVEVVPVGDDDLLPFADGRFELVIDRHESFDAAEVARVLAPGGRFITQQVGGRDLQELNAALDAPRHGYADFDLAAACREIEEAGLVVVTAEEAFPPATFHDVGMIVLFCRLTPWQVPGFSVTSDEPRLRDLHQRIQRDGSWPVHTHRFMVQARLPD